MPTTPFRQLALQGAAIILVLSLAWPYFGWKAEALPWRETSLAIGAVAFTLATLARQPWPWRLIHALFMPLAWFGYPFPG
jgi:chromate transport protein ChrA